MLIEQARRSLAEAAATARAAGLLELVDEGQEDTEDQAEETAGGAPAGPPVLADT